MSTALVFDFNQERAARHPLDTRPRISFAEAQTRIERAGQVQRVGPAGSTGREPGVMPYTSPEGGA